MASGNQAPQRREMATASRGSVITACNTLKLDPPPKELADMPAIKAAFRAAAMACHPDLASSGQGDGDEFKVVVAAYEVLLAERARRDSTGHMGGTGGRPPPEASPRDFDPMEQARRAAEIREDFERNREVHFKRFRQAAEANDSVAKELAQAAAEAVGGFKPRSWATPMREGWSEAGSVSARAEKSTGYRLVRTLIVTVTAPDGSIGTGEWEEWTGLGGAARRRSLVTMPARFVLARKVYGDQAFESALDQREAIAEFGKPAVLMAKCRKRAPSWVPAWMQG